MAFHAFCRTSSARCRCQRKLGQGLRGVPFSVLAEETIRAKRAAQVSLVCLCAGSVKKAFIDAEEALEETWGEGGNHSTPLRITFIDAGAVSYPC
jgi:hypothetical protein